MTKIKRFINALKQNHTLIKYSIEWILIILDISEHVIKHLS